LYTFVKSVGHQSFEIDYDKVVKRRVGRFFQVIFGEKEFQKAYSWAKLKGMKEGTKGHSWVKSNVGMGDNEGLFFNGVMAVKDEVEIIKHKSLKEVFLAKYLQVIVPLMYENKSETALSRIKLEFGILED
jgi:hypothetical protein